jgi:hypothetical protein
VTASVERDEEHGFCLWGVVSGNLSYTLEVYGYAFRGQGTGFRDQGLGFKEWGLRFSVYSTGFRIKGFKV